nr:hypothetical protein CPGR_00613 [Mycolicibacter nonchromogenicus]
MPGRKEILRGNRFPSTTVPATTAKSTIGHGLVRSPRPMPECATNSASTENIMKTFHSSGTPIGIELRMPKWNTSITNAAIAVARPPWEKNNTSGTKPSMAVEKCATKRDGQPGRRSSGKFSKNLRLIQRGRNTGLLLIIVEMTNGKCLVSFEAAAPIQMVRQISLAAMTMSAPLNRKHTASDPYTSPRAARKITLSRRPATASRPTIAAVCHTGSTPISLPSAGMGPVPCEASATTSITNSAPYSATSMMVRSSPLVSGTRSGHGGSRIVLGRNQYRIDPIGGKNRLLSGPKPQPSPTTSNSIV